MAPNRLPIPPDHAPTFGLIQESLASEPYHLLLAVILLNQTDGRKAIPIIKDLIQRFPTPEDLIKAGRREIKSIITPLGLHAKRTETLLRLATSFVEDPPRRHIYYPTKNYPAEHKLEIAHLHGVGPYAYDSWRIFCADAFRGYGINYDGVGNEENRHFKPEWTKVHPQDKELKAYITWMWRRNGFYYDADRGKVTQIPTAHLEIPQLSKEELIRQPDYIQQLYDASGIATEPYTTAIGRHWDRF